MVVVGLVCRRALALGIITSLPTIGVSVPKPVAPLARVMTPEEYLRVRESLPTAGARLLADVLVRSGLRLGEALALTADDVDDDGLLVRRCLSEPGRRFSEDRKRFVLRPTTKNGEPRRVVIGRDLAARLRTWCEQGAVTPSGLVFCAARVLPQSSGAAFPRKIYTAPLTPERLARLGTFTGPNGRGYQHGTMNGYTTGKCREACCRQAISEYSASKRREREDRRRDGPPSRREFSSEAVEPADDDATAGVVLLSPQRWAKVWLAAVESADLDFRPLARQTRHAHASWLNGGGISVEEISARLGHRDERSTRGYVRPVGPEPDAVGVLDALLGNDGGASGQEPSGAL